MRRGETGTVGSLSIQSSARQPGAEESAACARGTGSEPGPEPTRSKLRKDSSAY